MTRTNTSVVTHQRRARQGQITQCVQHFVAHRLIRVAQATRADNQITVKHNCVFTRSATKRQTIGLHRVHIRLTAEGTAVAELTGE